MLAKHQFAEVLVSGQQHGHFPIRQVKYCVIGDAWPHLGDIAHKVVILPEAINDLSVHALICQEIHATSSAIG